MSRKIDALIAEHVFGDEVRYQKWFSEYEYLAKDTVNNKLFIVPLYSVNIGCAWTVVEKMIEEFRNTSILNEPKIPGKWYASVGNSYVNSIESAPMAICLAALKAKGMEV